MRRLDAATRLVIGVALLPLVLLAGCGRNEADQALSQSEAAIQSLGPEVQQFMTTEYEQVVQAHQEARQKHANKDWKGATAAAKAATAKAESLTAQVSVRRTELENEWTALEATMPAMVQALKTRVDQVMKGVAEGKLPEGVTPEAVSAAQAGVATIEQRWPQAVALKEGGQLVDALLIGRSLKAEGDKLIASLGTPAATAVP
jgi:membrane-associated HD superfamily phosphohydrolase